MTVRVLSAGLSTTVQDGGRVGWRHLGIAACGALDPTAAMLANRLVGNAPQGAVLELTLHGPTLQFHGAVRLAICGARASTHFESDDGERCTIESGRPVDLPAGTLRIGALHGGARAWLAFAGGIDVKPVLGSRSTDLRGGFGGIEGRALHSGDVFPLQALDHKITRATAPKWWIDPYFNADADERGTLIHYVPAQHADVRLDGPVWQASNRSNRQGVRLEGATLERTAPGGSRGEAISAPVAPGTVQLPPDGQPIVLLADAQTVGGYPCLGHVIGADLPRMAQLRPGDNVRFQSCDAQTATRLACAARAQLARIALMIDYKLREHRE
ncbi:5-oxoprolinase subunit C family protein [Lysobacter terrae]